MIQVEGASTSGIATNIRALGLNFDLGGDAAAAAKRPVCKRRNPRGSTKYSLGENHSHLIRCCLDKGIAHA